MAKKKNIASSNQSTFELDFIAKIERSNVAVSELRTGLWAPIEKISANSITYKNFVKNNRSRRIKTSWGQVLVTGNILTQVHRDLIDCIIATNERINVREDGAVEVFFSGAEVMKKCGKDPSNLSWLRVKLREIKNTSIELEDKEGKYYSFDIFGDVAGIKNTGKFMITFDPTYRKYMEEQLTIGYLNELEKLLTIKHAVLRAIIRFFWTHKEASRMPIFDGEDGKPGLLTTVGYPTDSDQMVRDVARKIEANLDKLAEFGIYSGTEEVLINGQIKVRQLLYRKPDDLEINFIAGVGGSLLPR